MIEKDGIVQFGFIGTGGFIKGNHLPNALSNPKIKVRALCDLNQEILDSLTGKYSPEYVTTDFREILDDSEIDAVIIGTREDTRVQIIKPAAESGKAIFVEKPMSTGYEDSREIVDIINRTGVPFMVGFNRPYSAPMQDTRKAFRKVRGNKTMIHYRIVAESQLWPPAYQKFISEEKGSTIVNELTHIFDLLNWLIDDYPVSICAFGGKADDNVIVLEYPCNTLVSIFSGSIGTEAYPKEKLEIFTNYTTIVMDSFVELVSAGEKDFGDKTYPLFVDPMKNEISGEGIDALRKKRRLWYNNIPPDDKADGHYYTSRPSEDKGHYNELEYFRTCVANKTMPETNHIRGAAATIIALKAIESLKACRTIKLTICQR